MSTAQPSTSASGRGEAITTCPTSNNNTSLAPAKHSQAAASSKKKPRNTHRVKKADVGKLAFVIKSMPDEVIFRIIASTDPLTLLQLVRSCKTFRRKLLCDSALPIWEQARRNIGMNWEWSVPNELFNEADWAVLVFCAGCTKCGKGSTVQTDYTMRTRLCRSCEKAQGDKGTYSIFIAPDPDATAICDFKRTWLLEKWWNSEGAQLEANREHELSFTREEFRTMMGSRSFLSQFYRAPFLDLAWEKELPNLKAKLRKDGPLVKHSIQQYKTMDVLYGGRRNVLDSAP